ncbi:MAG TPA: heparinase II/III family protein [Gemmatimonadaceae bacterium]|jgi:hypothetical protein|nr:heparinase II/III family protein [Gemmatimonadaceae bacterium]
MSLLVSAAELATRRRIAAGGLSPLAGSLATDMERVLASPFTVPREKALLSRAGGTCERDGAPLAFDPWSPHDHRCPRCGLVHTGELHDRWWLYPYQLWIAERLVHGAVLFALRGDPRHGQFVKAVFEQYMEQYLQYPNRDNVLGPSRLFFSTYLESIWLLHLCVALDLLELAGETGLGARVRDGILQPGVALIAEFDEGASNRQVWNNAALLAAYAMLGDSRSAEQVVVGPSGLLAHLQGGLLQDGTWFEGENYHQFAHRGLWYGVILSQRAGLPLPPAAVARFDLGFAATFATALPDLTLPARKDSQYGTSLRQWRFAEACELGLARTGDPVLRHLLAQLYDNTTPPGETGRATASAEVERNLPPVRLSRASLGWKSLLFAGEHVDLPSGDQDLESRRGGMKTALLPGQGIAVFRRARGNVYAALDYGQSGGGHGHPDRLNLLLAADGTRWFDDLGTGSYVDPSLHWYRSTLAHNAPMVDGHSQWRMDGVLQAFAEDAEGAAGWVRASASIWPGVEAERTVVVMEGYLIDVLRWQAEQGVMVALPMHCDGVLTGQVKPVDEAFAGAGGLEDGGDFITTELAQRSRAVARLMITARSVDTDTALRGFVRSPTSLTWYTLSGPGQPAGAPRRFLVAEGDAGTSGGICTVWAWSDEIASVDWEGEAILVVHQDGAQHRHQRAAGDWQVDILGGSSPRRVTLGGSTRADPGPAGVMPGRAGRGDPVAAMPLTPAAPPRRVIPLSLNPDDATGEWGPGETTRESGHGGGAILLDVGEAGYRRSEESWQEAGRPTARVRIGATPSGLMVSVLVRGSARRFALADSVNKYDNEPADINGDGVQLYVASKGASGAWLLVPEHGEPAGDVRTRPIPGWGELEPGQATWAETPGGYAMHVQVPLPAGLAVGDDIALDVLVNQIRPGRERRSGQLVLSGASGEFVYLRGDRHDPARLLHFTITA